MGGTRRAALVAGDIGGTKTLLALYEIRPDGSPRELRRKRYVSRDYPSLTPILQDFLAGAAPVEVCSLGIAGPVEDNTCRATNLPWIVDGGALAAELNIGRVRLLNDFHAAAIGLGSLTDDDLCILQPGVVDPYGPRALLGAGTGLGEAIILPHAATTEPGVPYVIESEGGHADFAPRNHLEIGLLEFLLERHARVSVERVVSGNGLRNIYDYVVARDLAPTTDATRRALLDQDAGAVIGQAGLDGSDPACARTLEIFAAAYGAEAGNLALKCLPTGGVYLAGGIAPRLLPLLRQGELIRAFSHKGRMSPLLERMQVAVVLDPDVGLLGARDHAAALWSEAAP